MGAWLPKWPKFPVVWIIKAARVRVARRMSPFKTFEDLNINFLALMLALSIQVHALTMPGGKPLMETIPASPTSQTVGVEMAALDPSGNLTGTGAQASMAMMHGVLAALAVSRKHSVASMNWNRASSMALCRSRPWALDFRS